jgi:S1-C subfamily serine protease
MRDLPQIIRGTSVGRTVTIDVWRGGQLLSLRARVGQSAEQDVPQARSRRRRE